MMWTRPVEQVVSQATRAPGSCARMASRMASEIWSQILSGCPSVTDSDVKRTLDIGKSLLINIRQKRNRGNKKRAAGKTARENAYLSVSRRTWHLAHTRRLSGFIGPVPSAALDKLLFCCCEVSVPQVFGKVNDISLCSSDGLHKSGADAAACVVLEESLPHRGKVAEAPPEAG